MLLQEKTNLGAEFENMRQTFKHFKHWVTEIREKIDAKLKATNTDLSVFN